MQVQEASLLVVDNEPLNIKNLSETLKENGYSNIHFTTDSREVCSLCDKHNVDLIMLDIDMPYMDGFEVMQCLRTDKQKSEIPVVMLVPPCDMETINRALTEGAKDYLTKPFDLSDGMNCIKSLLEIRVLHKKYIELLNQKVAF